MLFRDRVRSARTAQVRWWREGLRDHVTVIVICQGINPLKGRSRIQNLAIDQYMRRSDLNNIVLQSNQPFDVKLAARRPAKFRDVGRVKYDHLTATRFAKVIADFINEDVVTPDAVAVCVIHFPLEDDSGKPLNNGRRLDRKSTRLN